MRLKYAVIVLLILLLVLAGCKKVEKEVVRKTPREQKPVEQTGLIMLTLLKTDTPQPLEFNVNKITAITDQETKELTIGKKVVPLKKLRKEELFASGNIKPGKITQIALEMEITNKDLLMPGNLIKIEPNVSVVKDKITIGRIQLVPEESFFDTVDEKKIFAPTFKIEFVQNGELLTFADRTVKLTRGSETNQTIKVGMNEKGKTGVGVGIWTETKLTLLANGKLGTVSTFTPQENQTLPNSTIEMKIVNSALSPNKITLNVGDKVKFKIKSLDETYGLNILDLPITVSPDKEEEFEIKLEKKGLYEITCSDPCVGREKRVIGRIVVI